MDNNYVNIFNIYEQNDVTNDDVIVTITPPIETSSYEYIVYNDENIVNEVNIIGSDISNIYLTNSGHFKILVTIHDFSGNTLTHASGIYNIDKEKPVIHITKRNIEIMENEKINVLDGVKVTDNFDGDISSLVKTNIDKLDL